MQIYVWRHNKKFHSYSMINEPCLNSHFYQEVTAIVMAESEQQAIELLLAKNEGWRGEDLELLKPRVYSLQESGVLFTQVQ